VFAVGALPGTRWEFITLSQPLYSGEKKKQENGRKRKWRKRPSVPLGGFHLRLKRDESPAEVRNEVSDIFACTVWHTVCIDILMGM